MEKKIGRGVEQGSPKRTSADQQQASKRGRKLSEYGRQLREKQKLKEMYGMREKQFRRFFAMASRKREGFTGEKLLSLLERRLDNVVFRLKFSTSREQARQIIVHGHVLVNGEKVYSPSSLVSVEDVVTLTPRALKKQAFLENVIHKHLDRALKVPDWLELDRQQYAGRVLRFPVRADVTAPVVEHLIVELYSK